MFSAVKRMFLVAEERKIPNIPAMSNFLPPRPDIGDAPPGTYAIVASQFNAQYVDALVENARAELTAISARSIVTVHRSPGSFEIPLLVQSVATSAKPDAIIALGLIIDGETAHARLIADAVTRSLLDISLQQGIPVIHEVLLVANEDQARRRCLESDLNRGIEAARAAVAASLSLKSLTN